MRIIHLFSAVSLIFSTAIADSVYSLAESKLSNAKVPYLAFKQLGNHIIAEFRGCTNLNNREGLETILREAALAAHATVLSVTTHQFEPVGVTGVAVLQESHISVHTWPEYEYAAVDIFTCGKHVIIDNALEVLITFFEPTTISKLYVDRGFTD